MAVQRLKKLRLLLPLQFKKPVITIPADLVERKIIEHIRETMEIEGAVKYEYDE